MAGRNRFVRFDGGDPPRRQLRLAGVVAGAVLVLTGMLVFAGATLALAVPLSLSIHSGAAGATVSVTGSGFSGATGLSATLANTNVAVHVVSDSTLTLVVPAGSPAGVTTLAIEQNGVELLPTFAFTVFTLSPLAPGIEVGAPYSSTLTAAGGTPPYSFSLSGPLPAGLGLSSVGVVSGAAKTAGTTSFSVVVSDATKLSATFPCTLSFLSGPAVVNATLGTATVGTDVSRLLSATGGTPPYQWSVAGGALPPGLVLTSGGILAGRPGKLGGYLVQLKVTDAVGSSTSRNLPLTVARAVPPGRLLITTAGGAVEQFSTAAPPTLSAAPSPVVASPAMGTVAAMMSANGARSWLVSESGMVVPLAGTPLLGELHRPPAAPVVAAAATSRGTGYLLVTAAGHVYGFGAARSHGSLARRAHRHAVGVALTPDGKGYWIASSSGTVRAFGDAPQLGSIARGRLHGTVVGIAASRDGEGYWLATSSGRVYGFGAAHGARLTGEEDLLAPVVAIAAAPRGKGFWLVDAAGSIRAFGAAGTLEQGTAAMTSDGSTAVVAAAAGR